MEHQIQFSIFAEQEPEFVRKGYYLAVLNPRSKQFEIVNDRNGRPFSMCKSEAEVKTNEVDHKLVQDDKYKLLWKIKKFPIPSEFEKELIDLALCRGYIVAVKKGKKNKKFQLYKFERDDQEPAILNRDGIQELMMILNLEQLTNNEVMIFINVIGITHEHFEDKSKDCVDLSRMHKTYLQV